MVVNELRPTTMCKNNSRRSAYSSGFSPLQNCNGLIGLSPANGYYSYTHRSSKAKYEKSNYNINFSGNRFL